MIFLKSAHKRFGTMLMNNLEIFAPVCVHIICAYILAIFKGCLKNRSISSTHQAKLYFLFVFLTILMFLTFLMLVITTLVLMTLRLGGRIKHWVTRFYPLV